MTQTRFFSFQNLMAPAKAIQAYVQVSVVWRYGRVSNDFSPQYIIPVPVA